MAGTSRLTVEAARWRWSGLRLGALSLRRREPASEVPTAFSFWNSSRARAWPQHRHRRWLHAPARELPDGRILAMAIFAVLGLTLLFPGIAEYLSRPFVFNFLFH